MIFAFPGQGSQFVGMGRKLYDNFSVAREVFNEVDYFLSRKLSNVVFNGPMDELTITENAQLAIMAVSMAALRVIEYQFGRGLFSHSDIKYVCGHSVGEYVALCAAKSLSLESTVKLLELRSKAMHAASLQCKGSMIVLLGVTIGEIEDILQQFDGVCEIANDNGGNQVVVSGTTDTIEKLYCVAGHLGIKRLRLRVSGPFHSLLMQPAYEEVSEFLKTVKIDNPIVPIVSNVTAKAEDDPEIIRGLLAEQIISRVRWREMVMYMAQNGINRCIEVGPGRVLSNLIKRIDKSITTSDEDDIYHIESFLMNTTAESKVYAECV